MNKIVMVTKCPTCGSHELSGKINVDENQWCNSCGFFPIPWSWSEVETNEHARRRRVFDVDEGTLRLLLQVTDMVKAKADHAKFRADITDTGDDDGWDSEPEGDWSLVSNDLGLWRFMLDLLRAIGVKVNRVLTE